MNTSIALDTYALRSLADASELIRQRHISPVELVTACLDRIERLQPRLNAFISVVRESALEAARMAERDIHQGRWKGPLHGIPVGIKDFYDTAGLRTTAAFDRFRDRIPEKDAVSVEKLKRAGAIVIGKTNMHTLGMGTTGLESCFGPVKNPRNADYIPGGSSSGSAAAVASGFCYATLDTDAIGSCRLPAACCGVVGYKGSYGLIDMKGILEGEQPPDETIRWLSHAGLTTRSVRDTALLLEALADPHDTERTTWRDSVVGERRFHIGMADNCRTDAEVASAFERGIETLRMLRHEVTPIPAPLTDFRRGIANIERDRETVGNLALKDVDALVLPTTATATLSITDAGNKAQALSPELTLFANYYGLPAVSVPCGLDSRGLPIGIQIVGKPRDDRAVLELADQYERAIEFNRRQYGVAGAHNFVVPVA